MLLGRERKNKSGVTQSSTADAIYPPNETILPLKISDPKTKSQEQKNESADVAPATFGRIRRLIHRQLIESIEKDGTKSFGDDSKISEQIDWLIKDVQQRKDTSLTDQEKNQIRREIIAEVRGLGPLAPLMADPEISDILVNGPKEVWVDRGGQLEKTDIEFDDQAHLRRLLDRLVASQGKHLDSGSPHVDAKLNDGSRLHAVIPPLCAKGPIISIRRFRVQPFQSDELIEQGFLNDELLALLKLAVEGRLNIAIAGGAAAGKTTLLNMLSRYIPHTERIITAEETAELRLEHPHVVTLESRPANMEGRGSIMLRDLLRTALRMRADRIIVGEVRGEEVLDMLQAMNVGHDGSLTTVHASNPEDVLRRLESLALMSNASIPREAVTEMVATAIDLIVHITRFRNGQRRITSIHEVLNNKGVATTLELYRFEASDISEDGQVNGSHVQVNSPQFVDSLLARGYKVPSRFLNTGIEQ